MKKFRASLYVVLMLSVSVSAYADRTGVSWSITDQPRVATCEPVGPNHQTASSVPYSDGFSSLSTDLDVGLPAVSFGSESVDQTNGKIEQLPSTPDSAVLLMYGLCSLGTCQLTRSARKLQLGHVPGWLHTGGPSQIGHTFALDLSNMHVLPLCWFQPLVDDSQMSWCAVHIFVPPPKIQCIIQTAGPRSPPLLSA